ncbi:MAG: hypothetical protein Q9210_003869 [Variospora velana]
MRYSSIIALALASAVVALPPSQSPNTDTSSSSGDTTADPSNDSSSDPGSEDPDPEHFPIMTPTGGLTYGAAGTGSPTPTAGTTATTTGVYIPSQPTCGSFLYNPIASTCQSRFLCPIVNGTPTLLCGDSCYFASLYSCKADALVSVSKDIPTGAGEIYAAIDTEPTSTGSTDTTSDTPGGPNTTGGTGTGSTVKFPTHFSSNSGNTDSSSPGAPVKRNPGLGSSKW